MTITIHLLSEKGQKKKKKKKRRVFSNNKRKYKLQVLEQFPNAKYLNQIMLKLVVFERGNISGLNKSFELT